MNFSLEYYSLKHPCFSKTKRNYECVCPLRGLIFTLNLWKVIMRLCFHDTKSVFIGNPIITRWCLCWSLKRLLWPFTAITVKPINYACPDLSWPSCESNGMQRGGSQLSCFGGDLSMTLDSLLARARNYDNRLFATRFVNLFDYLSRKERTLGTICGFLNSDCAKLKVLKKHVPEAYTNFFES